MGTNRQKYYDYPVGPLILGLILGPSLELHLRRALMSAGSLGGMLGEMVTSPLSLVLLALFALILVSQTGMCRRKAAAR